jgi:SAM-dependent methyltransferase
MPVPRERWSGGDAYEAYIGRWSRKVAPRFVDWLAIPPGARWLDVGCGTGALTGAVLGRALPSSILGVDPSPDFVDVAAGADRPAGLLRGRRCKRFSRDLSVDVVSGLVLNFVPDIAGGLAEMWRVSTSRHRGGLRLGLRRRMDLLRLFFDAAIEASPAQRTTRACFPIRSPGPSRRLQRRFYRRRCPSDRCPDPFSRLRGLLGAALAVSVRRPLCRFTRSGQQGALRERLRATLPTAVDGSIDHRLGRAAQARCLGRPAGVAPPRR